MKTSLLFGLLLFNAFTLSAQQYGYGTSAEWQKKLRECSNDTLRLEILHELGKAYLFRRGEFKTDLDSAFLYFKEAVAVSEKIGLGPGFGKYESLLRLGETYFHAGKQENGRKYFMQVIEDYKKANDKGREARTWHRLGRKISSSAENYAKIDTYFSKAIKLYQEIGSKDKEADVRLSMSELNLDMGKFDEAKSECLRAIKIINNNGLRKNQALLAAFSSNMAEIHHYKADYLKALHYIIEFKKNADQANNEFLSIGYSSKFLGSWYRDMGDINKSMYWFRDAIGKFEGRPRLYFEIQLVALYETAADMADLLIKQNRLQEAHVLVTNLVKKHKLKTPAEKAWIAQFLGQYYDAVGNTRLAEQHFLKMIKWSESPKYISVGY